jgi:hypothetical protein
MKRFLTESGGVPPRGLFAQLANAKTPQSADQEVQASGGCYLFGDDLFQVPMAQKAQLSPGGTIGPRKQKETLAAGGSRDSNPWSPVR